ncbi:MAG TPA: ABC transporter ATP-binding protein, partial [Rhodopila sp.]|nr:ABC transporter ATP-binding protein [Rhodopila sp.]
TVFENIATPLIMTRLALRQRLPIVGLLSGRRHRVMREIADEVRSVAAQLQIERLLDRRPGQLSHGQRQRVALGRAMVRHPAVFLMDEPLSSLDPELRAHMRTELMELHARLRTTFIYVTHDQTEAMTMSDRLAVMRGGRILQLATPSALYDRPESRTVAEFIGTPRINLFEGGVDAEGRVHVLGNRLPIHLDLPAGARVSVGLRPESLIPRGTGELIAGDAILRARLRLCENLGPEQILHFRLADEPPLTAVCRRPRDDTETLSGGETTLHFAAADCHVFGPDGARLAWRQERPVRPETVAGEALGVE